MPTPPMSTPLMSKTAFGPLRHLVAARNRTTPGRLTRRLVLILVLAGLAAAAALWASGAIGDAARTIGRDAEPSVALALRMEATLSDLDATAFADSLIDAGAAIGTSLRFRNDIDRLDADLVEAARNITYDEAEAVPLRDLQRFLGLYIEAVTEARFRAQGDAWLASRRVQWASRVDRLMAVPAAAAAAAVNAQQLEARYSEYRESSFLAVMAVSGVFAALIAALLEVQIWLFRRTHRLVNPLLAAATIITVVSSTWFVVSVMDERHDLRVAKADAYDSLNVLFEAKSAANAVRADMSLWLLDADARKDAQARITTELHALFGIDLVGANQRQNVVDPLNRAQDLEKTGRADQARSMTPHFGGLLGAELDNVTFGVAERAAATASVASLARAARAINMVQAREMQGAHREAVATWLQERAGGGADAFNALQNDLDRTIAVNQAEFDTHVASALATVAMMPFVACGALALTAVLAGGGIWLRLREYR